MNAFIHKARVTLIRLGKVLPFFVCFIVFIAYAECFISLLSESYVQYGEYTLVDQRLSWLIGRYFEYNIQMLVVMTIICYAIETCRWNKLTILYLAAQLWEKSYLATVELYPEYIYAVVIANILVSGFLCCKGLKILTSKT